MTFDRSYLYVCVQLYEFSAHTWTLRINLSNLTALLSLAGFIVWCSKPAVAAASLSPSSSLVSEISFHQLQQNPKSLCTRLVEGYHRTLCVCVSRPHITYKTHMFTHILMVVLVLHHEICGPLRKPRGPDLIPVASWRCALADWIWCTNERATEVEAAAAAGIQTRARPRGLVNISLSPYLWAQFARFLMMGVRIILTGRARSRRSGEPGWPCIKFYVRIGQVYWLQRCGNY